MDFKRYINYLTLTLKYLTLKEEKKRSIFDDLALKGKLMFAKKEEIKYSIDAAKSGIPIFKSCYDLIAPKELNNQLPVSRKDIKHEKLIRRLYFFRHIFIMNF